LFSNYFHWYLNVFSPNFSDLFFTLLYFFLMLILALPKYSVVNGKRNRRMGSSTIDRKQRKKRAAIPIDDGQDCVKIKLTHQMECSYIKYVRLNHFAENDEQL